LVFPNFCPFKCPSITPDPFFPPGRFLLFYRVSPFSTFFFLPPYSADVSVFLLSPPSFIVQPLPHAPFWSMLFPTFSNSPRTFFFQTFSFYRRSRNSLRLLRSSPLLFPEALAGEGPNTFSFLLFIVVFESSEFAPLLGRLGAFSSFFFFLSSLFLTHVHLAFPHSFPQRA